MGARVVVIAIAILLSAQQAEAAEPCTGFSVSYAATPNGQSYSVPAQWSAVSSAAAGSVACTLMGTTHGEHYADVVYASDPTRTNIGYHDVQYSGSDKSCLVRVHSTTQFGELQLAGFAAVPTILTEQCAPPPEECDGEEVGEKFWQEGSSLGTAPLCRGTCRATAGFGLCSGGTCSTQYTVTNQECVAGSPGGEELSGDPESCVGDMCLAKEGENCGYMNGDFACLPQIDDDGCAVFGDGGRACGDEAPMPPVPDNGTPGVPATPDSSYTTNQGDTYNYYNSGTVAGSNRPPGGTGDNPYDGDDGSGTSDGDGEGEGEGEEPDNPGDVAMPELSDDVGTFAETTSDLFDRVEASPLVSTVMGVASAFPAGSCPDASFELWGQSLDFAEPMCDLWGSLGVVLSTVFLAIYGWLGIRIVMSA